MSTPTCVVVWLCVSIITTCHRDPDTELEEEFVDNLFDVVCAALVVDDNKPQFVESEGVELMLLMLKNKRYARAGALKTLDFACARCVLPFCPCFTGCAAVFKDVRSTGEQRLCVHAIAATAYSFFGSLCGVTQVPVCLSAASGQGWPATGVSLVHGQIPQ